MLRAIWMAQSLRMSNSGGCPVMIVKNGALVALNADGTEEIIKRLGQPASNAPIQK
jgi:hypothetical protein